MHKSSDHYLFAKYADFILFFVHKGTLPTELGLLTNVEVFSVSRNPGIIGGVPDTLENLTLIEDAYFHGTGLTSGLETLFCGAYLLDKFYADCSSSGGLVAAEINCTCCTDCCSRSGTGCVSV